MFNIIQKIKKSSQENLSITLTKLADRSTSTIEIYQDTETNNIYIRNLSSSDSQPNTWQQITNSKVTPLHNTIINTSNGSFTIQKDFFSSASLEYTIYNQ